MNTTPNTTTGDDITRDEILAKVFQLAERQGISVDDVSGEILRLQMPRIKAEILDDRRRAASSQ